MASGSAPGPVTQRFEDSSRSGDRLLSSDASASASTLLRLAAQVERLSEVAEALTYRLLELEERMQRREPPDR